MGKRTWSDLVASSETLSAEDSAELKELALPLDDHNAVLLDNVHPHDHPDPDPSGVVYDLVALGAGAAGLVSAKQTARRGGRSALVEMHLHGGDCLNVGCVPSKALIRAARAVKEAREAASLGVHVGEVRVDFPFIMERMRRLRARIAPADAVSLTQKVGADVYQGRGVLTGPHTLEVNGKTLKFKKAVVATGASASLPPIPGLKEVPYVTNRTLFNLTKLPPRMIVIGAGPIGIEMAQTFALFGSQVTVLDVAPKVLPREDQDAAAIVEKACREDGVSFAMGIKDLSLAADGAGVITASFKDSDGKARQVQCETLLVATGRTPNVRDIGLEAAGIEFDPRTGIKVNDLMESSNTDIYAIGDCSSKWQFTHVAGTQAQMVVENAIFDGQRKVSEMVIPRCTFTHPEVAGTGASESELAERGIEYDVIQANLSHVDRAILESSDNGFCKLLLKKGTGQILGGTIVASAAGETISEVTLAINAGVDLATIGRTIHAYPTVAEVIAGCAQQYKMKHWKTK